MPSHQIANAMAETCEQCSAWAARSQAQLDNRLRNMAAAPGTAPYACPSCGSTAWATTTAFIESAGSDASDGSLGKLALSLYAAAAIVGLALFFS